MKDWKLVLASGAIALAGFALGAWVFGSEPVRAQQGPFRICVIGRQETMDINNDGRVALSEPNRTIQIPAGWIPIGGGGGSPGSAGMGNIVLCQR